ncbi:FMN-binding negative transcriptional regulator [Sphingomonas mollis]|uniref:FMN-binding negative transcriptional regulator n=1 Tax=Sphingomonas mollis TaxID=2795726 RepID=A0ABS0XJR7_9SPHN|nr:FMN-binding negative transcriptional regulator [Sphingomonas sp. BT553]
MHPNPAFRADEPVAAVLARAAAIGFAHLTIATPAGLMVAHVPVTRHGTTLRFHVARSNRIAPHLDGATALVSIVGPDGYVSPNWYPVPGDQVPTWNYVAIEIDGYVRALDEAGLVEQLDTLAATHELRVNPAAPWTRDKMDPRAFAAMLRAIRGFELTVTAIRTTTKLSQNKRPPDRDGVIAGLTACGNDALAEAMLDVLPSTGDRPHGGAMANRCV